MTKRLGVFAAIEALALSLFVAPGAQARDLPTTVPLPNGFMPEGFGAAPRSTSCRTG